MSEGQAYGMLIAAIVLGSWDTHKPADATDAELNTVLKYFHGMFNGWKKMCSNSSSGSCQSGGFWCDE